MEKSCDPDKEEGEWISKIDVQQQKDGFLKLSEQSNYGKCRRECKTVSKACEDSVSEVDTDLAELLWRNELSLSKLINEVCYSLSSACRKGQAKMKAGQRKLDEDFMHMSEDERKADKLLKQMRCGHNRFHSAISILQSRCTKWSYLLPPVHHNLYQGRI